MRLIRAGALILLIIVVLCARQWWGMMILSYLSIGVIALVAEMRNSEKKGWRLILCNAAEGIQFVVLWLLFYVAIIIHDFGSKK